MITNKFKNSINNFLDDLMKDLKKDFITYQIAERKDKGKNKSFEYYTTYSHTGKEFNKVLEKFEKNLDFIKFLILIEYRDKYRKNIKENFSISLNLMKSYLFKDLSSINEILISVVDYVNNYEDERNYILSNLKYRINMLINKKNYEFDIKFVFKIYSKEYISFEKELINKCNIEFVKRYKIVELF